MSRWARRRELRRLGAELARLIEQRAQYLGQMRRTIDELIADARRDILNLTRESLDHNDGVPPRLVEDLRNSEMSGILGIDIARPGSDRGGSYARVLTAQEIAELYNRRSPGINAKNALVDTTRNPALPDYRPR